MQESVQLPPALKSLELPFPPKVSSYLSGLYESQHQGSGLEFSELREYVPGDEVRSIDWRASARGQKTYVKTYVDLRNQDVIFAVDGSSSMVASGGEGSPLYNAGSNIGLIMRIALSRGDRVGYFTAQGETVLRSPVMGQRLRVRSWYTRVYNTIMAGTNQSLDWPVFVEQLRHNVRRQSLIVVISDDFASDESTKHAFRLLRAMGHRIWCIRVGGTVLNEAEAVKDQRVTDVETGEQTDWTILDKDLQAEFIQEDARLQALAATELKSVGVEYGTLSSPTEAVTALVRMLTVFKRKHTR